MTRAARMNDQYLISVFISFCVHHPNALRVCFTLDQSPSLRLIGYSISLPDYLFVSSSFDSSAMHCLATMNICAYHLHSVALTSLPMARVDSIGDPPIASTVTDSIHFASLECDRMTAVTTMSSQSDTNDTMCCVVSLTYNVAAMMTSAATSAHWAVTVDTLSHDWIMASTDVHCRYSSANDVAVVDADAMMFALNSLSGVRMMNAAVDMN